MNSDHKKVTLYYKRNNFEVEMPEWVASTRTDGSPKNAKIGDMFKFFGDFYADESRRNDKIVAETVIQYTVQSVSNEETMMTVEVDCDFGNSNHLLLMGTIRAKFFEIKNRKLETYKTEILEYPNLAIIHGTGDFERTTGCAKYIINGHQANSGSLGELHLMINQ